MARRTTTVADPSIWLARARPRARAARARAAARARLPVGVVIKSAMIV